MSFFSEAEADAFDGANVAIFPIGYFERLGREVGSGPFHIVSLGFDRAGIDVEDLLLGDVHEKVALP